MIRIAAIVVLSMSLLPRAAWAIGFNPSTDDGDPRASEVKWSLQVHGEVVAGTAEITLFSDAPGTHLVELHFPLPPGAVLRGAELWMPAQQRWERAETLGRREGEIVYTDVITPEQPRDPLLIQQIGRDAYRALVFPVTSTEALKVRIHYAHLLEGTGNERRLRIALGNPDVAPAEVDELDVSLEISSGSWADGQWNHSQPGTLETSFNPSTSQARFRSRHAFLDDDVVLTLVPSGTLREASALTYVSSNSEVQPHVLMRWAPDLSAIPGALARERNVVFVVDISGSMRGNKLDQTKRAVLSAIDALESDDRFGVVAFSSSVVTHGASMLGSHEKEIARNFVTSLQAEGGTNLSDGLIRAVSLAATDSSSSPIDIVFVSDGNPNVGLTDSMEIVAAVRRDADAAERPVRVFALGIGYDLNQDLINDIAMELDGEAIFTLSENEIAGDFLALFDRVRSGGLSSVAVSLTAAGVQSQTFNFTRFVPDNALAFGGRGGPPGEVRGVLSAISPSGYPVTLDAVVGPVQTGALGAFLALPALEAKARTDILERRADREGESIDLLDEAVIIAKTYGIVTRYTALIALESADMYAAYDIDRPARDAAGVATEAVRGARVDETRIGGEGGSNYTPPPGVNRSNPGSSGSSGGSTGGGGGCECAVPASLPWQGLLACGLVIVLLLRRGRGTGNT